MVMKTRKTVRYLWLSWILVLGWLFSFWVTYWGNYFDELSKNTTTAKIASKKNIITWVTGFCNIMIKELDEDSKLALSQSFFMASLCSNWKKAEDEKFFKKANELIQDKFSFKKAWFQSECRSEYKEDCDVAELADNLLTQILSEMFTIREATIFWIQWKHSDFTNGEKLKERKNKFIENYLWVPKAEDYCKGSGNHKQVCKMIENQIKQFKKALKNLQYIDLDKLHENEQIEKCNDTSFMLNNLAYCWLVWEIQWWLDMFVDLVYNEIQRYSLFSSYYGYVLSQKDEITNGLKVEYEKSLTWPDKFMELAEETFRDLNNIAVTYPLHVVLVAFEEDLLYVRDKYLSKIVTPFYCLYYKLRNVQFDK